VQKNMRKALRILLAVLGAIVTPSGGQPVDASATFTTGSGVITIILTDLQTNPTSVGWRVRAEQR
jgi:hypothetical protein